MTAEIGGGAHGDRWRCSVGERERDGDFGPQFQAKPNSSGQGYWLGSVVSTAMS